jgi:hypothetical protein
MGKNPGGDLSTCFPSLKEVLEKGKACEWQKPVSSSCCGKVYWWHGWRERWYGNQKIWVRRLICSFCKKGRTFHPKELWPRFQAASNEIIEACEARINHNQWVAGYSRHRIRWWVRVAHKIILTFKDLLSGIEKIFSRFPLRAPLSRRWLTHPPVT